MEQLLSNMGLSMLIMLYVGPQTLMKYFKTWRKLYSWAMIILDDLPFSPHIMRVQGIQIHSILKRVFLQTINQLVMRYLLQAN